METRPQYESSRNSKRSFFSLEKHEGTVVPAHFYEALDEQSYRDSPSLPQHVSASQVMKSWTENIGFPLISVTRDYETGKIKIEQVNIHFSNNTCTRRFQLRIIFLFQSSYKSPRARKPAPDQEWIVPLTYTTKSEQKFANTQPSLWSFAEKATILPIEVPNTDWLLFNLQHAGTNIIFYITPPPLSIHPSVHLTMNDIMRIFLQGIIEFNTTKRTGAC